MARRVARERGMDDRLVQLRDQRFLRNTLMEHEKQKIGLNPANGEQAWSFR
jgi:hypothetical protein